MKHWTIVSAYFFFHLLHAGISVTIRIVPTKGKMIKSEAIQHAREKTITQYPLGYAQSTLFTTFTTTLPHRHTTHTHTHESRNGSKQQSPDLYNTLRLTMVPTSNIQLRKTTIKKKKNNQQHQEPGYHAMCCASVLLLVKSKIGKTGDRI